jgi:uncharacterized protein YecE (DUF72 family)
VYIGTSGWSYKSWEKHFYPGDVRIADHFHFYATQFPTVEINLTFYRLPPPKTVKGWRDKAPDGFIYAVKGSRFITHMKKLRNVKDGLDKYFHRIGPMKSKVGVVLWQLPPMLTLDLDRLEGFLKILPKSYCYAVEFWHRSWMVPQTFAVLRKYNVGHASVSSLAMPMDRTITSDIVYIRFHGLKNGAAHDYTRAELQPWARHIREQAGRGKRVFVYFNNDVNVRAPGNAKLLMEMVGEEAYEAFAEAA